MTKQWTKQQKTKSTAISYREVTDAGGKNNYTEFLFWLKNFSLAILKNGMNRFLATCNEVTQMIAFAGHNQQLIKK